MKFELSTLPRDSSDEAIIAEIRRVDAIVGEKFLTAADFNKHGKIHSSTIRRRFGGWKNTLEKAGIGGKYSGVAVSGKMKSQSAKNLTDEQILSELKRIAKELNHDYVTQEEVNSHSKIIAASAVIYRFGSWLQGLEKAGLKKSDAYRIKSSENELFENILNVWTHYGRQPFYSEMGKAPSTISAGTYESRFGSWRKALEAFVKKMNQDGSDDEKKLEQKELEPESKKEAKPFIASGQDRHGIPLGLRYRVLSRDRFKCVRCGATPASDPTAKLHVDHIIPFSKVRETKFENLQTLCEECNLGKGNRYFE